MKFTILLLVFGAIVIFVSTQSCNKNDLDIEDNISFKQWLSEYQIYDRNPGSLSYSPNYNQYEIATGLFTDYSEKQRLIYLPEGMKMVVTGDGIPEFPDSTILVKTFFYYKDKRDPSKGKRIIETRLLIKNKGKWNAATYIWNQDQTDALLSTKATDTKVSWIDENGLTRSVNYKVPDKNDCRTCHQFNKVIMPIGPKTRNLNIDISVNGSTVNQLNHFHTLELVNAIDVSNYAKLPDWNNLSYSLADRARAYLDINCGHCHNKQGFADNSSLTLTYETSVEKSGIKNNKEQISVLMERGNMPLIGTTVIDREALALIKGYLETL